MGKLGLTERTGFQMTHIKLNEMSQEKDFLQDILNKISTNNKFSTE
jgi:hypothetical protein